MVNLDEYVDERLKLTDAQMLLTEKFCELCSEMNRSGIGFINQSGKVYLINLKHVDELINPNEMELECEEVPDEQLVFYGDMADSNMKFIHTVSVWDHGIGIRFK